mgnify:CR=1 FL=1
MSAKKETVFHDNWHGNQSFRPFLFGLIIKNSTVSINNKKRKIIKMRKNENSTEKKEKNLLSHLKKANKTYFVRHHLGK